MLSKESIDKGPPDVSLGLLRRMGWTSGSSTAWPLDEGSVLLDCLSEIRECRFEFDFGCLLGSFFVRVVLIGRLMDVSFYLLIILNDIGD